MGSGDFNLGPRDDRSARIEYPNIRFSCRCLCDNTGRNQGSYQTGSNSAKPDDLDELLQRTGRIEKFQVSCTPNCASVVPEEGRVLFAERRPLSDFPKGMISLCRRVSLPRHAALLQKFGYQTGPACLMARAQTGAGIAMEVFVEQNVITEVGVGLEKRVPVIYRPFSLCAG